ncbi:MAG TPA: FAD-binding oxidoreductase, partial [Gemmatimonadales bacterium]|nr:FAD-binding oxidoreductase [Gemmatimonadales bacterium]
MSDTIFTRLRALLGTTGVERDAQGVPRATPESPDALTLVCRLAHEEGWKIRVEGRGTWLPPDAPADLVVSTRGLEQVVSVSPADLVATVQAGTPLEALRRRLADYEMWLALDPPGRPERSIGSVIATATSGPLRQGFGPVRDHVLGCSVATGDGRLVNAGGRVVKNVAGYDLTKLQVGGFGGFGIIAEVHLRLRALPRADVTLLARGTRDTLTSAAREVIAANLLPAALELLSPALAAEADWVLAARFV